MLADASQGYRSSDLSVELVVTMTRVLENHNITIFPPINLYIGKPPHLLIVSPRDKILYFDRQLLKQELSVAEMEKLESSIDGLRLSALVEELGGLGGTYPPIISEASDISFIIDTAVEEWLHQYLVFKPLGFLYFLDSIGFRQDPDVITMNETLVGLISQEIGSEIYTKYYQKSDKDNSQASENNSIIDFKFNDEMRETRKQVDIYLARGDIKGAEDYMELRRQLFVSHGYNIRKLNQAYFAFHGIYGSDPASVSPIYNDLKQLRARSQSVADFLNKVSAVSSYDELKKVLQGAAMNSN